MNDRNEARAMGHGTVYQASGDQHIVEHHHHAPDWSGPDSVRHPSVGRAPVVLRDRTAEMERLRTGVGPGVGNVLYVLHGLGGCGKTAVAYTLFRHATETSGRIGLWVNASDPGSLRAGMLAVAADRGATDAELTGARTGLRPAADLVWHYLENSDRPWLLVLDNADTPAVLRDGGWLRTSPSGTVVVTTRQAAAHWWPGAELLQFGLLPREDAARVLQDLAPEAGSIEEARQVADRLGHLPLALTLAGGFLSHQVIDPWTLSDYRLRLDDGATAGPIELIDRGAESAGADSRRLVSRTWELSLDALAGQGCPEAAHLLRLLALWSDTPLPLTLLSNAGSTGVLPPAGAETALRGLLDHSLTEIVPDTVRCLRTHGLLLDSVARATPAEQREQLACVAAELLLGLLPAVPERGAQHPVVPLLGPHVIALLRRVAGWRLGRRAIGIVADCALRLVLTVHRSGDYSSALTLAAQAFELTAPLLGAEDVRSLRLRLRIGRALFRLGKFEEAETYLRELLETCERVLGPDAPETLEACLRLANCLFNLGGGREAIAQAQRAARGRAVLFGELHQLTLIARLSCLEAAGTPEAAGVPERDAIIAAGPALIEDCRRGFGEDHPHTAVANLDYAFVLLGTERAEEALPHSQAALAVLLRAYGTEYPLVLAARQSLGVALAALGRTEEAIEQMGLTVAGRLRLLGADHPWTRQAQQLLAEYGGAAAGPPPSET